MTCAALAIAAVAVPFVVQSVQRERVEQQIAALRPQVDQAEALRRRILSSAAGSDVFEEQRKRVGDVLQTLATLTDVLPDDTFLNELTLRARIVTISGQSAGAAKLIAALAAERSIRNPAFAAPVTRSEGTRSEGLFHSGRGRAMIESLPTGRRGQAVAVALLLLVLAAAWMAMASPLLDWHADRAAALEQRTAIARRMAQVAGGLPELQQQAAAAAAAGPVAATLLDGSTDAVAGARLQQLVQDMAGRAGATLSSTEALPAEAVAAYRRIGVRVGAFGALGRDGARAACD